jgi:murein DD-endopeptidase MepM/ murein hydrolase activator NlpD
MLPKIISRKFFSILFLFVYLLTIFPSSFFIKDVKGSNQSQEQDETFAESIEVIEERSESSKTFLQPDGSYRLVSYSQRIHYKSGSQWRDIDNTVVQSQYEEYMYRNLANDYVFRAGTDLITGISYQKDDLKCTLKLTDIKDVELNNSDAQVYDNVIRYPNIYPNADLEFTLNSDGFKTEIVAKDSSALKSEIHFDIGNCNQEFFDKPIMTDHDTSVEVNYEVKSDNEVQELILKPDYSKLGTISGEVRIDPSVSFGVTQDVFVSTTTSNGERRFMAIGRYTDYTITGNPTFGSSRALIHFGTLGLPSAAVVTNSSLRLYHYGTNSGNQALYVSLITSGWGENSSWPGPSHSGDYGSTTFPYYSNNFTALPRDIPLNTSLITALRNANSGVMVRNYDESARGVVVCSSDNHSGPCNPSTSPQLIVDYYVNQSPNPPNLDYPNSAWEIGPSSNSVLTGVNCDTSGLGVGCDLNFRVRPEDPDDSFPLNTTVDITRSGSNANYSFSQSNENWNIRTRHLTDGNWTWRARTSDSYNSLGNWSVNKSFIVDTSAPSTPNMVDEPIYSPGIQNEIESTISTDLLIGDVRYNFEISEVSDFSIIKESSGWIVSNQYTFANLSDNSQYYYRAKAKDKLNNSTGWGSTTNSIQDSLLPEIQNISVTENSISPINNDNTADLSVLSFNITESNWESNSVELLDTANSDFVVRSYTGLDQNAVLIIDGKDNSNQWLNDGFYKVRIRSIDLAGNESVDEDTVIVIDNHPPFLNISSPADGFWTNQELVEITGATEADAELLLSHTITSQQINGIVDSNTGVFVETISLINGENSLILTTTDPIGNTDSEELDVYLETESPQVLSIQPINGSRTNNRTPVISLNLEDTGYNDYISGIKYDGFNLSLWDYAHNEIVLVSDGIDVSSLGYINHNCNTSGLYGLSNAQSCTYSYVLDSELQPDGIYSINSQFSDVAGNITTETSTSFELDSHTYFEVVDPTNGKLFNYSQIELNGQAEKGALLRITGVQDYESFEIESSPTDDRVTVYNCRDSESPNSDGIREICDWKVSDFQLNRDIYNNIQIANPVSYMIEDDAGNISSINHSYGVNLYAVNLSLTTDLTYFSPNGDGRQDGIEFTDISTDGAIDNWEIKILDSSDGLVRTLSGTSSLPVNQYWDGKDESNKYVDDGEYTYTLSILTTDDIKFETERVAIYAVTELDNEVIISFPNNNSATTRGITNVQGQAPRSSGVGEPNKVRICVDTVGLSAECDFEYISEVDINGSFSSVVPLIRLDGQTQTEHFLTATAFDRYGNETPESNRVRIIVDTRDPFVSVSTLPALTGVNDPEAYQEIIEKLDNGDSISRADIDALRTVVLRSEVTPNTERVRLAYADHTNFDELNNSATYKYIGYSNQSIISALDFSGYFGGYMDGINPVESCPSGGNNCVWDFYYPIPPLDGGLYEINFEGKKGETIQTLSTSLIIDGSIPLAPMIIDINKVIEGKSLDTSKFNNKYYSNSDVVEIRGAAGPQTQIQINDQNDNILCITTTNTIGLFNCTVDLSSIYFDLDSSENELFLTTTASDGLNQVNSLDSTTLVVDMVQPEINSLTTTNNWRRSGDLADISVIADEPLNYAYIQNPFGAIFDYSLNSELDRGYGAFSISGLWPEGLYEVDTIVQDIAGNKNNMLFEFYIDNTSPDSQDLHKSTLDEATIWGSLNGIDALVNMPAAGRLVPEYVIRGNTLYLHGSSEKFSSIELNVDGKYLPLIKTQDSQCDFDESDTTTDDGVITKQGELCEWSYDYKFNSEKGYVFTYRVIDRARNESLVGEDEIVYYDKTAPQKPEVYNISSNSYNPIVDFQKDSTTNSSGQFPVTKDIQVSVEGYGESLSDYQYWLVAPNQAEIDYQFFQNSGKGTHKRDFEIGVKSDDRDGCTKLINGRKTGVCEDGLYTLSVRSIDAAGNNSEVLVSSLERDTVAPEAPQVTTTKQGGIGNESLSIAVQGEPNSTAEISVSSKYSSRLIRVTLDGNGSYSNRNLIGTLVCGDIIYSTTVKLLDRAQNVSKTTTKTIKTGECPRCGPEGGSLGNPVHNSTGTITSGYRTASRPNHNAIDIALAGGSSKSWREPIYAAGVGTVKEVKQQNGVPAQSATNLGSANYVKILHDDGKTSIYYHLDNETKNIVNKGQRVDVNTVIGHMGNTGHVMCSEGGGWKYPGQSSNKYCGTHLHFAVYQGKSPINPLNYLGKGANVVCKSPDVYGGNDYPEVDREDAIDIFEKFIRDNLKGDTVLESYNSNNPVKFNEIDDLKEYLRKDDSVHEWCGIWIQDLGKVKHKDDKTYSDGYDGAMILNPFENDKNVYLIQSGIWAKYWRSKGPCGPIGVPKSTNGKYTEQEAGVPSHSSAVKGTYQRFQTINYRRNSIYWHKLKEGDNTRYVVSEVANRFEEEGGTWSKYGFPTNDTSSIICGGKQKFEHGKEINEISKSCLKTEIYNLSGLEILDGENEWSAEELEWLLEIFEDESVPHELYDHGYIDGIYRQGRNGDNGAAFYFTQEINTETGRIISFLDEPGKIDVFDAVFEFNDYEFVRYGDVSDKEAFQISMVHEFAHAYQLQSQFNENIDSVYAHSVISWSESSDRYYHTWFLQTDRELTYRNSEDWHIGDFTTDYAAFSSTEDWAESVSVFIYNRNGVLDNLFEKGTEKLQQKEAIIDEEF